MDGTQFILFTVFGGLIFNLWLSWLLYNLSARRF